MSVTTPASVPATGSWQIDATHSTVTFTVTHNVVATFRAGFHGISGSLEDGVLSGSVAVENLELGGPGSSGSTSWARASSMLPRTRPSASARRTSTLTATAACTRVAS